MTAPGSEARGARTLAARCEGGSVDRLFRDEAPGLLRYFRRKTGGDDSALDLLQDVFLRASRITGWSQIASPAAYLQRMARNLMIDRARRLRVSEDGYVVPLEMLEEIAVPPDQHAGLEAQDLLAAYERALATLSHKSRTVFLLHRAQDLTYRQIADQLDISVATVEYHMMRALAHIDRVLGGR